MRVPTRHSLYAAAAAAAAAVCTTSLESASEAATDGPDDVLVISQANYTKTVEAHPLALLEFYAPWCETALCQEVGVGGYPTLKIYHGKTDGAAEYSGPRKADGVVSYMLKQNQSALTHLTSASEADKLKKQDKVVAIAYVSSSSADKKALEAFHTAAEKERDSYTFGYVDSADLAKAAGITSAEPADTIKTFVSDFIDGKPQRPLLHQQQALALYPDILVEIDAPWRRNCKKLEPNFAALAGFYVEGHPAIKFGPAGGNLQPSPARLRAQPSHSLLIPLNLLTSPLSSSHPAFNMPVVSLSAVNKNALAGGGNRSNARNNRADDMDDDIDDDVQRILDDEVGHRGSDEEDNADRVSDDEGDDDDDVPNARRPSPQAPPRHNARREPQQAPPREGADQQRKRRRRDEDLGDREEELEHEVRAFTDAEVKVQALIDYRDAYGLSNYAIRQLLHSYEEDEEGNMLLPPRSVSFESATVIKTMQKVDALRDYVEKFSDQTRRRQDALEDKFDLILSKLEELKEDIKDIKTVQLPPVEINKLTDLTAQVFYSPEVDSYSANGCLFGAIQRLITRNAMMVGSACKAILDGDDDRAKKRQIWGPVKKKLSTLRCNARDYITEEGGSILSVIKKCTKAYGIRIIKKRVVRFCLLRFFITQIGGRLEDGKTNPKLWSDVDASLKEMFERQRTEPNVVKREIKAIVDADKNKYGTFSERLIEADNAQDQEILNAFKDD
ncbi:hypothetical protein A4X13_0g7263 [Tilletia indica]|uniref:protein disulfide-isomerase n=1 Tax=Tilletia indica TaxID=43049 RepID=A0A8T8SKY1_9BASI|nr:hypothetical protein A4X13_0g7263 [Tilletia indica]